MDPKYIPFPGREQLILLAAQCFVPTSRALSWKKAHKKKLEKILTLALYRRGEGKPELVHSRVTSRSIKRRLRYILRKEALNRSWMVGYKKNKEINKNKPQQKSKWIPLTWTAWRSGWAASRCCVPPWSWPGPPSSPASLCPPWWGRGRAPCWRLPGRSASGGRWPWSAGPSGRQGRMRKRERKKNREGLMKPVWEESGGGRKTGGSGRVKGERMQKAPRKDNRWGG